MKYINLGGHGPSASALSLGCMRLAEKSIEEISGLIQTALELGINHFDHADIYGGGASEEKFAAALQRTPQAREAILLQSKCGIRPGMYDFSRQYILDAVDGILKRLGTEYLDLLLLHRPDTLMEPGEVAEAFQRLRAAGKVRFFGVSNMNQGQMALLQSAVAGPLLVNQLQFSLAHTGLVDSGLHVNMAGLAAPLPDEGTLEYCRAHGVTIQTWSSLQYGFFEGTFLGSGKYPALNNVLGRLAEEKNVTAAAVAIAWILRHPAGMQAVVGTTSPARLTQLAAAAEVRISRQEWYELYRAAGNDLP